MWAILHFPDGIDAVGRSTLGETSSRVVVVLDVDGTAFYSTDRARSYAEHNCYQSWVIVEVDLA